VFALPADCLVRICLLSTLWCVWLKTFGGEQAAAAAAKYAADVAQVTRLVLAPIPRACVQLPRIQVLGIVRRA